MADTECDHPAPVHGVMAHEFAHYQDALGPEGTRRTVTMYGPVIGGLPIKAWHCEKCGLLLLAYPDGRKEERHLYPGPQPGLIANPTPVIAQRTEGKQAQVSGVSVSDDLFAELASQETPGPSWLNNLPALGVSTWLVVGLLALTGLGLLLAGILATYDYQTSPLEGLVLGLVGVSFAGAFFIAITSSIIRRAFKY